MQEHYIYWVNISFQQYNYRISQCWLQTYYGLMVTNNVGHCSLWELGYETLVLTQVGWSSKSSNDQGIFI